MIITEPNLMGMNFSQPLNPFPGKRIESMDILRGFAIIVILVLHRLHYNWAAAAPGRDITDGTPLWVLYLLFYLMTMAGIFSLISGTVNSFKAYQRKAEGRSALEHLLSGGLSAGIWILMLHYLQSLFFSNGFASGRQRFGILLGWMQTGEIIPITSKHYIESNALSMIGLVVIFITLVLYLVFRRKEQHSLKKDIRLYLILATVLLAATPFVRYQLGLLKPGFIHDGNYFGLTVVNLFIGVYGVFPMLAYGFYGVAIGAAIAGGVSRLLLKRCLLIGGLAFFLVGGLGFFVHGGLDFATIFANTMINQYHWLLFRMNQLGFFLLLFWLFLSLVDFATRDTQKKVLRFTYPLRIFGMVSLTVFFSEPILAELLRKVCDLVLPGWNESLLLVILFGILCVCAWWVILKIWWKTVRFAGSLEWITARVIQTVSGKRSTRSDFNLPDRAKPETEQIRE